MMNKMSALWAALLFFSATSAQTTITSSIDKYMQAQVKVKEFSGAVLVVKKGTIVYDKAFGLADREWNNLNTTQTKFRIGSNTKQFTAACILQLEAQGKLKLTDKLTAYIPSFPKGDSVTLHMLLSHTSGIASYTGIPEFWDSYAYIPMSPDSFIAVFKNKPFDFTPGTNCKYSNSGYHLLGMIIEKISGESYSDYLTKNILVPTGLQYTRLDRLDTVLPNRAKGYYKEKNIYYNAMPLAMEAAYSAGAMYSTTGDLYKWAKALHHNGVLSAASVKKMTTHYATTAAGDEKFGYGLLIDSIGTHPQIWHDGSIPGFTSWLAYYPNDDVYVVAVSNTSFSSINIGTGLAHVLFNILIELPYVHKAITLPESTLTKFVGSYDAVPPFEIILRNGKLYRHRPTGRDIELKPESSNKLFYDDDSDRQLLFEFAGDTVSKVFIIAAGIKTEIKKKN